MHQSVTVTFEMQIHQLDWKRNFNIVNASIEKKFNNSTETLLRRSRNVDVLMDEENQMNVFSGEYGNAF